MRSLALFGAFTRSFVRYSRVLVAFLFYLVPMQYRSLLALPVLRTWLAAASVLTLWGCAQTPPTPQSPTVEPALAGWSARELPGKRQTRYSMARRDGQACVLAQAERSASLWRRSLRLEAQQLGQVEFAWWITALQGSATVTDPDLDDAPARLVLAFEGDAARLSVRNRMLFELAHTMTGEAPPFATLMYVWDAKAAPETVVISQRSDRIRKIVVGSGPAGAPRWQRFSRDVAADYQKAFGEAPGALIGAAFMTDGDNTGSRAEACYGALVFRGEQRQSLPGSLEF